MLNNWKDKLEREFAQGKYGREANVMKSAVYKAICDFCEQDEEFAEAVEQGGSFEDCMKEVAKGVGQCISDLDAYKRAVGFYFKGATVVMQMRIEVCGEDTEGENGLPRDARNDKGDGLPRDARNDKSGGIVLNLEDFL